MGNDRLATEGSVKPTRPSLSSLSVAMNVNADALAAEAQEYMVSTQRLDMLFKKEKRERRMRVNWCAAWCILAMVSLVSVDMYV